MGENIVTTTWEAPMHFNAAIDTHVVNINAGIADGGTDSGPGPKKLMLAALAGCTGIDVVLILKKMKVDFSTLIITVTGTLTETHPRIYEKVHIDYNVGISERDRDKMEKAVMLSMDKYCGVSAMFNKFARVSHSIQIAG